MFFVCPSLSWDKHNVPTRTNLCHVSILSNIDWSLMMLCRSHHIRMQWHNSSSLSLSIQKILENFRLVYRTSQEPTTFDSASSLTMEGTSFLRGQPLTTTVSSSLPRQMFLLQGWKSNRIVRFSGLKNHSDSRKSRSSSFDLSLRASGSVQQFLASVEFQLLIMFLFKIVLLLWSSVIPYISVFKLENLYLNSFLPCHCLYKGPINASSAVTDANPAKSESKEQDLVFVAGATGKVGSRTVRLVSSLSLENSN